MEKHLPMRRFKLLIPDSSELVSPGISPKFLGICSFDKSPSSSGTRKKKQKKKKRGRWTKLFHTRLFSPPQITRRSRKYVSTFWLRGLHTFVNPLTDLRRCLRDSSSTLSSLSLERFFRLYPGRKIYGPLNDSTEFNCHVAGYYRAPTSLRIAAYGLDVGSMNVEYERA